MNIFGLDISMLELILVSGALLTFIIQVTYYLFIYASLGRKKNTATEKKEPVSVIICAKNEETNLENNLSYILEQNYPDYEVVVVNDCSEDNTDIILEKYKSKYSHLKVSTIKPDEKFSHGKKLALTLGIKASSNDLLLFTDADCRPVSKDWIGSMQKNFQNGTEINLGYGAYVRKKGFLDKIIRFDTVFIAMNYLGLAGVGQPYMGVGRNLSYRKELFFKNKGFASHAQLSSGDDDLFINETANAKNTCIELDPNSFTMSEPEATFNSWIRQKKRHHTTWPRYKFKHKFILGLELFSRFVFYGSVIALFALNFNLYILLGILLLRACIQLVVVKNALKRLNENDLLLYSLLFDIILPIVYFVINLSNKLSRGKKNKWK